jgi:predicted secreted protein
MRPSRLAGAALLVVAAAAPAQTPAAPQNVVGLSASASVEVAQDLLTVVFSTTREGRDAAGVQGELKQALDAALAEARSVAQPGQIDVQTGNFALLPRYSAKGALDGWQGRAELIVDGRDVAAIARLTGRVATMSIARVGFSLSRAARDKAEAEASTQAIARFRDQAGRVSREFGFGGWSVREVSLASDAPSRGIVPMLRAQAARTVDDAVLPVEAGRTVVTATVSGSVQMSAR